MNELNQEQTKALQSLSRAFLKCKKANLVFQGMDGNLLAIDEFEYRRITATEDFCEQQYKSIDEMNQGESVQTHNTYMDSGGW